jgi:hypothetical protein
MEKSRRVRMSTESMSLVERMPDPLPKITPEPNAEGDHCKRTGFAHR